MIKDDDADLPWFDATLAVAHDRLGVSIHTVAMFLDQKASDTKRAILLDRGDRRPKEGALLFRAPESDGVDLVTHACAKFMSTAVGTHELRRKYKAISKWFLRMKAERRAELVPLDQEIDWEAHPDYLAFCRSLWELGCPFPKIGLLLTKRCGVQANKGTICGLVRRYKWAKQGFVRGAWTAEVEAGWIAAPGNPAEPEPVLEQEVHRPGWRRRKESSGAAEAPHSEKVSEPSMADYYQQDTVHAGPEDRPQDNEPAEEEDDEPKQAGSELVILKDGEPMTTSLLVAKKFGKKHQHVLRDIDTILDAVSRGPKLDHEIEFVFLEKSYVDRRGKAWRMFEMNEVAFTLLISGYTGAEAMRFKVAFITEFHRMRNYLRRTEGSGEMRQLQDTVAKLGTQVTKIISSFDNVMVTLAGLATAVAEIKAGSTLEPDRRPPPRGAMSIQTFCSTQPGLSENRFRALISNGINNDGMGMGLIKHIDDRWVCTERGIESGLVFDAPCEIRTYGSPRDATYAKLTKKGVDAFVDQVHHSRAGTAPDANGHIQPDIFGTILPFIDPKKKK